MPAAAIGLLSGAIIAYQVLLMRLFSIVQWQHFAVMIISLALLGFGASGTFLALARRPLVARFAPAFATFAALFGVTSVLAFAVAQRVPFNPLQLVWQPGELLYLSAMYAILAVPFFCGATCIGLAFSRFGAAIGRIYFFDLLGAGLGAMAIVGLLTLFAPETCLRIVGAAGLAAAALSVVETGRRRPRAVASGLLAAAVLLAVLVPSHWVSPLISEYKGLSMALRVPDAAIVHREPGPMGTVAVVDSPTIPFRHAPGLSLNSTIEPPEQLGVFTNGAGPNVITRFDERLEPLAYLDDLTWAAPYHLIEEPEVLVLGAGPGADVLMALYHGARQVTAVELDPVVVDLVRDDFGAFAGRLYNRDDVHVEIAEARGFAAAGSKTYDLIQVALLDSFAAAGAGATTESYLYTVEGLGDYLSRLAPGGILSITRWLKLPPRDALKLFATATAALEAQGVDDPGRSLALIRGWKTTTLLVRNGPFREAETEALKTFTEARSFDVAWYPGMTAGEANRFNRLQEPYFHEGADALLGPDRARYLDRYKFDIAPSTDDRPFFFDFFKWRSLSELFALRHEGGAALLDMGTLILTATVVQGGVISLLLILLPLWIWRRNPEEAPGRRRVGLYFLCLGVAFMLIEITFIQRFVLFLSHPLTAVAVVLAGFLVFAGFGSGLSARFRDWMARRSARLTALDVSVAAVAVIALAYLVVLPPIFGALLALSMAAKIAVSLALIAPLAFFMGMPFPLGLARVAGALPGLVPWAWGVNGFASVLSAVLASLLAVHTGFAPVAVIAVALYLLAAVTFRRPLTNEPVSPGA